MQKGGLVKLKRSERVGEICPQVVREITCAEDEETLEAKGAIGDGYIKYSKYKYTRKRE